MEKIGVFGGTFNPPHAGHLLAAAEAKQALGLDRVLFIPDAEPPHKALAAGSPDGQTRLELCRAATADCPWAEVSDMELRRSGKSYTAETLRLLAKQYPDDILYLLTGTDMFLSLHSWYAPEEICSRAVIVGMCRREDDRAEEFQIQKQNLETRFGARVELVQNRCVEVSSSTVRRLLILGGAEHYVPEPVLRMIREKGLYGVGRNYRNLPIDELREVGTSLLKPQRVRHVLGCAETAVKLARYYGADETTAMRAGLLHDVTKALDGNDQLLLVDKYDILISDFERSHPKVLHAKTGAAAAEQVFGEPEAVVEAIRWHTTGRADMSLMEKIIYLADYLEPTRDFPGVEDLRGTVYEDLDGTLLRALDMVVAELREENKTVCRETPEARDYLYRQLYGEHA